MAKPVVKGSGRNNFSLVVSDFVVGIEEAKRYGRLP